MIDTQILASWFIMLNVKDYYLPVPNDVIIYNFYFQQPTFQKGSRIWVSEYRNNFLQHG